MIELLPGSDFDDRYTILKPLGEGGMGIVYHAVERELNRPVAIKLLHFDLITDNDAFLRFKREGKLLSQLRHENISSVFRFGLWHDRVA